MTLSARRPKRTTPPTDTTEPAPATRRPSPLDRSPRMQAQRQQIVVAFGPARRTPVWAGVRAGLRPPIAQRKGGDHRATARTMVDPTRSVIVLVIAELLDRGHAQAIITTALGAAGTPNDTSDAFTTVARAESVLVHYALGLAPARIRADAVVCQDVHFDALLALSLAVQQAGVASAPSQVLLDLLVNGRAAGAITTAHVAAAGLLTTTPRAEAVLDHLGAGGTAPDANRAAAFAPIDAAVFASALTEMRALSSIPAAAALPQDRLDAVLAEREHLSSHAPLRANAVALAAAAPDGDTASHQLAANRPFGYRADFSAHADQQAGTARVAFEQHEAQVIRDESDSSRHQAVADKEQAAFDVLNKRQQKALGGTLEAARVKQRPFTEAAAAPFDTGKLALATVSRGLATSDIAHIDLREQQRQADLAHVRGPAEAARVKETYRVYFATVGFHADALAMLAATGEDQALATTLMGMLSTAPAARALLLQSGLDIERLRQVATVAPVTLGALLTAGVVPAAVSDYAAGAGPLSLLLALQAAGAPAARINGMAAQLATLAVHVNDATERAHLATLLTNHDGAADIVALLAATPGTAVTKLALLVGVRACAANATDLAHALALCGTYGFSQARILTCFTTAAPPLAAAGLAQLVTAVSENHLAGVGKNVNFNAWLNTVDQLVAQNYLTIAPVGAWHPLPLPPLTYEHDYQVVRSTGGVVDTFCVHYHPGAGGAAVGSVNASASHFKPQTGGIIRRFYDDAGLAAIKQLAARKPP